MAAGIVDKIQNLIERYERKAAVARELLQEFEGTETKRARKKTITIRSNGNQRSVEDVAALTGKTYMDRLQQGIIKTLHTSEEPLGTSAIVTAMKARGFKFRSKHAPLSVRNLLVNEIKGVKKIGKGPGMRYAIQSTDRQS